MRARVSAVLAIQLLGADQAAANDDSQTAVVTQHAPSLCSVPPESREDRMMACFVSNPDRLVSRADAVLWVHGGGREGVGYMVGTTLVVSEPRGYSNGDGFQETGSFRADYTVELH